MPKLIPDLQEDIFSYAKKILLEKGYRQLTIRSVARACHVAVGTVYNYYGSKDILVASVMLEDWNDMLERGRRESGETADAVAALRVIYGALMDFTARYADAWDQYRVSGKQINIVQQRHQAVVDQLCGVIGPMLERFYCCFHRNLPPFLAETLLNISGKENSDFDEFVPIFEKLLKPETKK